MYIIACHTLCVSMFVGFILKLLHRLPQLPGGGGAVCSALAVPMGAQPNCNQTWMLLASNLASQLHR